MNDCGCQSDRCGRARALTQAAARSSDERRTWTVALPAGMQLINANKPMHWHTKAKLIKEVRATTAILARAAKLPRLQRASVVVEYRPPDKRRRDVHNLYPTAKAAIDGLVDAGVLPDDNDHHLLGPDMRRGQHEPLGRLVLHITDMGEVPDG